MSNPPVQTFTLAAPAAASIAGKLAGDSIATFGISGTYTTLTFVFEGSMDGVNFSPLAAVDSGLATIVTGTIAPANSATYNWLVPCANLQAVRLRVTAIASGAVVVNAGSNNVSFPLNTATNSGNVLNPAVTGPLTVTSTSASALAVGRQGATNPVLQVNAATSSVVTGVSITGAAAAGGVAVAAISSGTNESLTLDAKGSGSITLQGTATGNIVLGANCTGVTLLTTGSIKSSGTTGIGYASGAGGTIAQITSRTTGVTLSKTSGQITLVSAAGSATPFTFTVTNTLVAATDTIIVSQVSGTDAYSAVVSAVAGGSYKLTITDLTGTTVETPVFNVIVIKDMTFSKPYAAFDY